MVTWQRLGSVTLGSSADTMDLTITAKKYLKVLIHTLKDGTVDNTSFRFGTGSGVDTGNNYTWNRGKDGSNHSQANYNYLRIPFGNYASYSETTIINVANKAKICHIECCSVENTGANNAPTWVETSGVWHNTSAQITEVKCWQSGGGSFATGTTMTILGAEDDVLGYNYPNLTNGTIFEESDTGKHYMFDGTSTWNEM